MIEARKICNCLKMDLAKIETEAENDHAILLASELEHKAQRTVEENAILDLLLTLIEKFEEETIDSPLFALFREITLVFELVID